MANLKGVEEFIYVLAAALIILTVLFLLFGLGPLPPAEDVTLAEFPSFGLVGQAVDQASRASALGSFTVGITQRESLKSVPQLQVASSAFGMEMKTYTINIPDYLLSEAERAKISFRIYNTNSYGNLIIKWNGLEFFNEKAGTTDYTIVIGPSYLEETNTLEVLCTGPGLAFWASTVYVMNNFDVDLEYGPATIIPFQLTQTELSTMNRMELGFSGTADSALGIEVNGNPVYNSKPSGYENIVFSPSNVPLNVGNNMLTFSTSPGTATLSNVELSFFLTTNLVTRSRDFNMTDIQMLYLEQGTMQGKVEYDIEAVSAQGSIQVMLNDRVLNAPMPQEGTNTVYFGADQAREGENTLAFSGTGQFDIGDVEVLLVR